MPLSSMTGFARTQGRTGDWTWTWEIKTVNASLRIVGVLPCLANARETISQEVEALLKKRFGALLFPITIKRSARVTQSYLLRKPMHLVEPRHETVKQYNSVAKALIARGKKAA